MINLTRVESDLSMVSMQAALRAAEGSFNLDRLYIGHGQLAEALAALARLRENPTGGRAEFTLGRFTADIHVGVSALHISMHFNHRAQLLVSVHAQRLTSFEFDGARHVTEARLHSIHFPAELDRFVLELQAISTGHGDLAVL
jgi:hypothetical protein